LVAPHPCYRRRRDEPSRGGNGEAAPGQQLQTRLDPAVWPLALRSRNVQVDLRKMLLGFLPV
jgi:hypothetical protein